MIKKILLTCVLCMNISCNELIKNDYSYIKNIDKEFIYKAGDQQEYIYIIKNENGKLVKKNLIKITKKYNIEGQKSIWKILNYVGKIVNLAIVVFWIIPIIVNIFICFFRI